METWESAEAGRAPAANVAAATPPSWGPKGAAALDVIKRAPEKEKDEAKETDTEAKENDGASPPAAETTASAVSPDLTNAVGAKGSWSSLVARDVSASPKRSRRPVAFRRPLVALRRPRRDGEDRVVRDDENASSSATNAGSNGGRPDSPPFEPTPSGSTTPSSPARALAGAWAKGPVTTALKASSHASKPPPPPSASAAGSPVSSSSGDSNATENENKAPGGKNVSRDANDDAGVDADATAKAKASAEAKMFVRKEDDFPGLGGSKTNGGSAAPVEESAGRAWGAGGGVWASRVVR